MRKSSMYHENDCRKISKIIKYSDKSLKNVSRNPVFIMDKRAANLQKNKIEPRKCQWKNHEKTSG